jgi:hypothetical protein
VIELLVFLVVMNLTMQFVSSLPSRHDHEPRAARLQLRDPNAHVCAYADIPWGKSTIFGCTTCHRPPPTLMPGPGQSCSR